MIRKVIAALSKPALIERERDIQVSVADARRLKQALPHAELVLSPVVNHVLKAASSDDKEATVATYADPHPRLAPGVTDAIISFIKAAAKSR
ncbi:MAG TPA: hypothetical protein VGJ20_22925 [Xanthobacteraceae bacterium]|jgi:hypothetical protein